MARGFFVDVIVRGSVFVEYGSPVGGEEIVTEEQAARLVAQDMEKRAVRHLNMYPNLPGTDEMIAIQAEASYQESPEHGAEQAPWYKRIFRGS